MTETVREVMADIIAYIRASNASVDNPVRLSTARFHCRRCLERLGDCKGPYCVSCQKDLDRLQTPEWKALRVEVFIRDGGKCTYCGVKEKRMACDHVIPRIRGGSDDLSNLTTACRTCNSSKRDDSVDNWRAWQAAKKPRRKVNS